MTTMNRTGRIQTQMTTVLSRGLESLRNNGDVIYIHNLRRPLRERLTARQSGGPYMWRPTKAGSGRGFYCASHGLACDANGATFDLRLEKANEHLTGRTSDISGYYCDRDGDGDKLQPIIARLPHSRGFLAGWTMGAGMCASVDGHVYRDVESAAFAAHSMAEYDADKAREYSEDEAEQELD